MQLKHIRVAKEMAKLQKVHEAITKVRRNTASTASGFHRHGLEEVAMPGLAIGRLPVYFSRHSFENVFNTRIEGMKKGGKCGKLNVTGICVF